MSSLFEGLSQADEDPSAGYEPSYQYFSHHDEVREPEGHWTVTGDSRAPEHSTDGIGDVHTENDDDCDGDLVIVDADTYCLGAKTTTNRNIPSGSVHRNPGEYNHSRTAFKIPKHKNTVFDSNSQEGNRIISHIQNQSVTQGFHHVQNRSVSPEFHHTHNQSFSAEFCHMQNRSVSPEFPIVAITGGGGPKRKVKSKGQRTLPEKRLRGNAIGCNMRSGTTPPLPTPTIQPTQAVAMPTSPQKMVLNLKLNKCDSPKGKMEVQKLLSNSPSSRSSLVHTSGKTNGRLWKHVSAPTPQSAVRHGDEEEEIKPVETVVDLDLTNDEEDRPVSSDKGTEIVTEVQEEPVTEETEELEEFAICFHCGNPSLILDKCDYEPCAKPIDPSRIRTRKKKVNLSPDNTDRNIPRTLSGIRTDNFYAQSMTAQSSIYSDGEPMFPVKPKKILKTYAGRRKNALQNNIYRLVERVPPSARRKSRKVEEPVCVTISSDEDEPEEDKTETDSKSEAETKTVEPEPELEPVTASGSTEEHSTSVNCNSEPHVLNSPVDLSIQNVEVSSSTSEPRVPRKLKMRDSMGVVPDTLESIPWKIRRKKPCASVQPSSSVDLLNSAILDLRGVRIGTLKIDNILAPVVISQVEVTLKIAVDDKEVELNIASCDMIQTEIFDGRPASLINLFTTAGAGVKIRERCRMRKSSGWFDPGSMLHAERRIILIAKKEPLHGTTVKAIHDIFTSIAATNNINLGNFLVRLSPAKANEILVDNSNANPRKTDKTRVTSRMPIRGAVSERMLETVDLDEPRGFTGPIVKLCCYPPPPSPGAITITTEDLFCLNKDEFLNDVIIDFYLKYLTNTVLSGEDRQRTHIFSSFFYKRLTQRPKRVHLEDTQKPIEQRRHSRVKNWTRHVNLFEKDFIVVPINESAHWYLAIICFPGLAVVSAEVAAASKGQEIEQEREEASETRTDEELKVDKEGKMEEEKTSEKERGAALDKDTEKELEKAKVKEPHKEGKMENDMGVEKELNREQGKESDKDGKKEIDKEGENKTRKEEDVGRHGNSKCTEESEDRSQVSELDSDASSRDGINSASDDSLDQPPPCKIQKTEFVDHFKAFVKNSQQDSVAEYITDDEDSKLSAANETGDDVDDDGGGGGDDDVADKKEEQMEDEEKENEEGNDKKSEPEDANAGMSTNTNNEIQFKKPCILLFDSLLGPIHNTVVRVLKEYLEIEWESKKAKDNNNVLKKELIRGSSVKVPQQSNYSDCGVFLLHYVEKFFTKPVQSFSLPIQTLKEWFPEEEIPQKREHIIELINQLQKEQEEAKKAR